MENEALIQWLLAGDPSIRWQVMQDLLVCDEKVCAHEKSQVAVRGWGAKLLSFQDVDGRWGGQLYNHKWLSTTYSLLLLRRMGLSSDHPRARQACRLLLEGGFQKDGYICFAKTVKTADIGANAMLLSLLTYFEIREERTQILLDFLLSQQLENGCWQPEPGISNLKYICDTTWLCLEALREAQKFYPQLTSQLEQNLARGLEFFLDHRLYQNEGAPIHKNMTLFSFPPRWHFDILAGLDFFQKCRAERDPRLKDAVGLLLAKRNKDGSWNLQHRHAGQTFFEMEVIGQPSRWNTLRALRVLKWWYEK